MRTTSRTIAGFVVVGVAAVSIASLVPPQLRAEAQEAAKPGATSGTATVAASAVPYACTHFPIMQFDGYAMYEAERHEVEGCGSPVIDYVYGNYSWPMICPACDARVSCQIDCGEPKGFRGLLYPIPHDHEYLLPRGRARRCSTVKSIAFNRFLEFKDVDGNLRPVKVFQYECDLGAASEPPKPTLTKTTSIALECQRPGTVTFVRIPESDCTPLPNHCNPSDPDYFVYRLIYQKVQILALVKGD